jgi:hypothetical protein
MRNIVSETLSPAISKMPPEPEHTKDIAGTNLDANHHNVQLCFAISAAVLRELSVLRFVQKK